jgi:predicted Zn finger-like uncharacterized protein
MLIVCPSCAMTYNLSAESLGANGRSVRCVRCKNIWHAEAPREAKLLAAVGAIAPEPDPGPDPAASAGVEAENVTLYAGDDPAVPAENDEWTLQPGDGQQSYEDVPDEAVARDNLHEDLHEEVEAPPIVPVDLDQGRPLRIEDERPAVEVETTAFEDIESLAARRSRREARRRRMSWPLSRLQTAILALIIFDATLVGWRSEVVRLFPQTASFYAMIGMPVNLRGLAFDGVTTAKEQHEGVPVLVVEGTIVNVARKPVEVPRLKFSVRSDTGNEIYSWTMVPPRTVLPSGETLAFRSRLASPPPEGRDVLVRFFARRDLVAGMR